MTEESNWPPDRSVIRLPYSPEEWVEVDDAIFHAAFQCLGWFVEQELGREPGGYDGAEQDMYRGYRLHAVDAGNEQAIDLWLWYRDELSLLENAYIADIRAAYGGSLTELRTEPLGGGLSRLVLPTQVRPRQYPHDHVEKVRQQKLEELIGLRRSLWT